MRRPAPNIQSITAGVESIDVACDCCDDIGLSILCRQVGSAVPAFFGRYQDNTRKHDDDGAGKHAEDRLIAPDQVAVDYRDDTTVARTREYSTGFSRWSIHQGYCQDW